MSVDASWIIRKHTHVTINESPNVHRLTLVETAVLREIADSGNDDGFCSRFSEARLARHIGGSERTVMRVINRMRKWGVVAEVRPADPGRKIPALWKLNLFAFCSPEDDGGVTARHPSGVTARHPSGVTARHPSYKEEEGTKKGQKAPPSSSVVHERPTTTADGGVKRYKSEQAPDELVKVFLFWEPPAGKSGFDRNAIDLLWGTCRSFAPGCTVQDVIRVTGEKMRTHSSRGRPIENWVGFLLASVPRAVQALQDAERLRLAELEAEGPPVVLTDEEATAFFHSGIYCNQKNVQRWVKERRKNANQGTPSGNAETSKHP